MIKNKVVRCTEPFHEAGGPVIGIKRGKTGAPASKNVVKDNEAERYICGPENNVGQSIGIFENNKVSSSYAPPVDTTSPSMPGDLKGVVVPGYGIDLGWLDPQTT